MSEPKAEITGLGGKVPLRYRDDVRDDDARVITIEGSINREVRITLPLELDPSGDGLVVSAIDLQSAVNSATWTAEVDSWPHPADRAFLAIHPGLPREDAAEPTWAQPPTPWKVADAWAEHIVDRLLADVPALGTDREDIARDGIELVYSLEADPGREPMSVCIHADLDGFLVNAFDRGRGFGPDLIPLSSAGLGLHVPNRVHPRHGDSWFADIYPRLRDAVALAAEAVAAIRDGKTCTSAAGIGEHEYPCRRPLGHAEDHPDIWAEHASGAIIWTAAGVTSSHPKATVLR